MKEFRQYVEELFCYASQEISLSIKYVHDHLKDRVLMRKEVKDGEELLHTKEEYVEGCFRPILTTNSSVLSLFSILEMTLAEVCDAFWTFADRTQPRLFEYGKTLENPLKRVRCYLEEHFSFGFPKDAPSWSKILESYLIRNAIVHNYGSIAGMRNEQNIREYVRKRSDVALAYGDRVVLTEDFCDYLASIIKDILTKTRSEISNQQGWFP